jgi:hypothetical protein
MFHNFCGQRKHGGSSITKLREFSFCKWKKDDKRKFVFLIR